MKTGSKKTEKALPAFLLKGQNKSADLPLKGKRIVLTRGAEHNVNKLDSLIEAGAEVILFPVLKFREIPIPIDFPEILKSQFFDLILFASANAVRFFFNGIHRLTLEPVFQNVKFVAIGEKTAEAIKKAGHEVWFTGSGRSSADFLLEFGMADFMEKKILLPGSLIGRNELSLGLREKGAEPYSLSVYDTVLPDETEIGDIKTSILRHKPDCYIFTSPSSFDNLVTLLQIKSPERYFKNKVVVTIGKTTAEHILRQNVAVSILPQKPDMEELSGLIIEFYKKENKHI